MNDGVHIAAELLIDVLLQTQTGLCKIACR